MSAEAETTASTVVAVSSSKYVADDVDPSKGASASNPNYMTWADFLKHLEMVKASVQVPDPVYKNKSLFLFGPENPIRKIAITIAHHPWFDRFILFLIEFDSIRFHSLHTHSSRRLSKIRSGDP